MLTIQILPEKIQRGIQILRSCILRWAVQRPILAITVILILCVATLPLVTAAALIPVATILTYTGVIASQGMHYLVYNVLIQGILLTVILVTLFIATFTIATSASVLHSYKSLPKVPNKSNE